MKVLNNLKELCLATGVAGAEVQEASLVAEKLLKEYTNDTKIDVLGSVQGFIPSKKDNAKTILLDAHIDEIGMIITSIDDKGFLRFSKCGGIDLRGLSAQMIKVHGQEGKHTLTGVVGSKPPHILTEAEANKVEKMDDMFIDIGMSKEEAEKVVDLGDVATIHSEFNELLNGRVSCKALDDRAGVASILHALDNLKGKDLDFNIAVQFSTREELGGQGAKISAYTIEPDFAIAVDVGFATTPDAKAHLCGELDKGVMVGYHPTLDKSMSDQMVQIAKDKDIPYQIEVSGGRGTGTNADSIITTKHGVKTSLLSIPERYMHTPIEVVSVDDVKATGNLISEFILNFDESKTRIGGLD